MAYSPTNEDFSLLRQKSKEIFSKVEILNRNYKVIDTLHGALIDDSFSIDSESAQRRSYTCNINITDSSFLLGNDKKIWIDKFLYVYYGIKSIRTGNIKWFKLGTFTFIDAVYSSTENLLSLTCGDLMANYDGTKNGEVDGHKFIIPAGEDIRASIIALLKSAGILNYTIEDIKKEIPYDLEFTGTITYYDILKKICDLYDSWEFYFDEHGNFIWRQIPTGLKDECVLDDSLLQEFVAKAQLSTTFKGIYNVTEIWGKIIELGDEDRYCYEGVTYSNNVYGIALSEISSFDDLDNFTQIAIKIPSQSQSGSMVKINELSPLPLVRDDNRPIATGDLLANTTYVFRYRRTMNNEIKGNLLYLGQYQAYGKYKEINPDCQFSVPNLGYEILHKVNYDNLYSDDLCYNQAEYLTYQSTAMKDSLVLDCIVIPWLEVNQKIKYTFKGMGMSQYMIKSISWATLEGKMTITLYKFLESFSYVKKKETEIQKRIM